jgi:hypothetical protein
LNLYLSNLLAIIVVTLWNFLMNARCNWRLPGLTPRVRNNSWTVGHRREISHPRIRHDMG